MHGEPIEFALPSHSQPPSVQSHSDHERKVNVNELDDSSSNSHYSVSCEGHDLEDASTLHCVDVIGNGADTLEDYPAKQPDDDFTITVTDGQRDVGSETPPAMETQLLDATPVASPASRSPNIPTSHANEGDQFPYDVGHEMSEFDEPTQ